MLYSCGTSKAARAQASLQGASDYTILFGSLTSLFVIVCVVGYISSPAPTVTSNLTVAVGVASLIYFASSLGSFLQRLANADAGAQLFAHASRNLLLIVPSSFFLAGLLSNNATMKSMLQSELSSALIGVAIGLLGERLFGEVNERAASLLGIKNLNPRNERLHAANRHAQEIITPNRRAVSKLSRDLSKSFRGECCRKPASG